MPVRLYDLNSCGKRCAIAREFSLFCAYPKAGFTEDLSKSLADICAAHTRMI